MNKGICFSGVLCGVKEDVMVWAWDQAGWMGVPASLGARPGGSSSGRQRKAGSPCPVEPPLFTDHW